MPQAKPLGITEFELPNNKGVVTMPVPPSVIPAVAAVRVTDVVPVNPPEITKPGAVSVSVAAFSPLTVSAFVVVNENALPVASTRRTRPGDSVPTRTFPALSMASAVAWVAFV